MFVWFLCEQKFVVVYSITHTQDEIITFEFHSYNLNFDNTTNGRWPQISLLPVDQVNKIDFRFDFYEYQIH